ncbi:MAG: hypothetical protein MR523_05490 [Lachnospiraceae bacterium]|nr:hypothetical protein [Lachnospiraceae bacterium]
MDISYTETLSQVITDRLLSNWDRCDKLGSGKEYDELTDECGKLHYIVNELGIHLPDDVRARF